MKAAKRVSENLFHFYEPVDAVTGTIGEIIFSIETIIKPDFGRRHLDRIVVVIHLLGGAIDDVNPAAIGTPPRTPCGDLCKISIREIDASKKFFLKFIPRR